MRTSWIIALIAVPALCAAGAAAESSGTAAYRALGIEPTHVLTGTVLNSKVLPGERKQVICLASYITGKKDEAHAVNVRLGVFEESRDGLVAVYTRDFGAEQNGFVANGDIQLIDLDLDRVNEIIISWDDFGEKLIERRKAEVILHDGARLTTVWSGLIEYDATKAAREVPEERRDRYSREFDFGNTLRTRGATLFMNKTVIAVAGQRLAEPKVLAETFKLRGTPEHW